MMEFKILGPLEVLDDGEPIDLGPFKQRSLLALMVINAGEVVSTDRIIEALWGEEAEGKESALWVHVSRLRSALEPGRKGRGESKVLVTRDPGYVLIVEDGALDAARFEALAAEGRSLTPADPEVAAEKLAEALALWRGPVLDDFSYESFARNEVERLTELRIGTLEDRIDVDLARGLSGELVSELEALVHDHPLRGRPVGQLMLALHRSNRQAEALRAFERHRRTLADELGIDPSAELRRLEEQILVQDERLEPRRQAGAAADTELVNPYKGLRPFLEDDADDFHGRDRLVAGMVRTLGGGQRMLAVVGPSGSGKSSVVRAGLVPALRQGAIPGSDAWLIAQMVPGAHPFAELESALLRSTLDAPDSLADQLADGEAGILRAALRVLPDDTSKLVLVIDQFEELFTLVDDEEIRRRFLANLITSLSEPHGRISLVLTLRADLYDRPLRYPDFGNLLTGNLVNVTALTTAELEEAALEPAHKAGVDLEPALLARLIADVGNEPGALPLFQYALTELFDRRSGETLTVAAYRSMGGVNGALSRRAEDLYSELDPEQQDAVRQLFLRLVAVAPEGERSRRRLPAGEVISLGVDVVVLREIIEHFGRHRLLSFDADPATGAPTIEVAHEALLTSWDRLHAWIDDYEGDLQRLASLRTAVEEWRQAGENPDYLLTGSRLVELQRWRAVSPVSLTEIEQAYLDAGEDRRRAEDEAEARRQKREVRRLRVALVAVLMGLAGALIAGAFAFAQQRRADDATHEAETRRLASEAVVQLEADRRMALLLAAEAHSRDPNPETLGALQRVLSSSGPFLGYVAGGNRYDAVEWADSGDVIVAAGEDGIDVFDAETLERTGHHDVAPALTSAPASTRLRTALDVSRDGRFVVLAARFGGATLVDRVDGDLVRLARWDEEVLTVAFSNQGDLVATADIDGIVRVWRVPAGDLVFEVDASSPAGDGYWGVRGLTFTPDDAVLVTSDGPVVRRWSAEDGTTVGSEYLLEVFDPELEVSFPAPAEELHIDPGSPDRLVVVGAIGYGVHDLDTGTDLGGALYPTDRTGLTVGAVSVRFLDEGGYVVLLEDGRIRSVDGDDEVRQTLDAQMAQLTGLDADPTGRRYVAAAADGLLIGSLDGDGLIARAVPATGTELSVSADGTLVSTTETATGFTSVWRVGDDGIEPFELPPEIADQPTVVEAHPGSAYLGQYRIAADLTPSIVWLDSGSGEETGVSREGCGGSVAYSGDGTRAAVVCFADSTIEVVELSTGEEISTIRPFESPGGAGPLPSYLAVRSFDFAADGSRLVVSDTLGRAWYFDADSGRWITGSNVLFQEGARGEEAGIGTGDALVAGYSPDGRWLATIDETGAIALRDPATEERIRVLRGGGVPTELLAFGPLFSADGRFLLSTSDGSARLWDIETGSQIGGSFPNDVGVVANGAEGDELRLVTGVDGQVLHWNLDTESWAEIACRAAGRNLTRDEWDAIGPTDASYRATCPAYPVDAG